MSIRTVCPAGKVLADERKCKVDFLIRKADLMKNVNQLCDLTNGHCVITALWDRLSVRHYKGADGLLLSRHRGYSIYVGSFAI